MESLSKASQQECGILLGGYIILPIACATLEQSAGDPLGAPRISERHHERRSQRV
jgi:hypothetical protein